MAENRSNKKLNQVSYYLLIFLLAAVVGYYVKQVAVKKITVGFEDGQVETFKSAISFEKVEEEVKRINEEQLKKSQESATIEEGNNAGANGGACVEQ